MTSHNLNSDVNSKVNSKVNSSADLNKKSPAVKPFRLMKTLVMLALLGLLILGAWFGFKGSNEVAPSSSAKTTPESSTAIESVVTKATAESEPVVNPVSVKPVLGHEIKVDKIVVDKSDRKMTLFSQGDAVRSYRIALGDNSQGHKRQEGDERTPEGTYTLDYKNENSIAHRSIHISYPNAADQAAAASRGVSPGGDIMIHGQMNGFGALAPVMQQRDWTNGCIAVTNEEMDEIMAAVDLGTPIEIVW